MIDPIALGYKRCLKCGDYYPPTSEFFGTLPDGTVKSPCHACTNERRQEMAAVTPCCVPGCTNPRYNWRIARCREHSYYHTVLKPRRESAKANHQ